MNPAHLNAPAKATFPATARRGLRLLGAALLGLCCLGSAARLATEAESNTPAAAAKPASAADGAATSSPVSPQAESHSQPLPAEASAQCKASSPEANCCCAGQPALQLDLPPVRLPAAVVGKAYKHVLKASGGQPPYRYRLTGGTLPEGIKLDEQGLLSGIGLNAQRHPLNISVSDAQQRQGQQSYILSVITAPTQASKPAAAASAASASSPAALKALSLNDAQAKVPAPRRPQVEVFKLAQATLDLLLPTPSPEEEEQLKLEAAKPSEDAGGGDGMRVEAAAAPAPVAAAASAPAADTGPPAPGPLTEPQIEQLKQLLTPLIQVEFPNRQLFEAALDAQLCQFVAELTRVSASKQGIKPPPAAEFARACPPNNWPQRLEEAQKHRAWVAAEPAKALAAASRKAATTDISWQELAPTIMPPELRAWLVERSGRKYPLSFDKKINWDGAGCGCVQDEIGSQIYGFFPEWWSSDKAQQVDFSRLHRISVFGLAINDDGSLAVPEHAMQGATDFVRQARVHGTALDLTLYRNDWLFLKNADSNERSNTIERMIREAPGRAMAVIDRPLNDWRSRLYGVLPGLGHATRMGDGLTLFLDELPPREDLVWRGRFDAYYKKLVEALIVALRQGSRDYTLNLVISDRELARPGAFELNNLFDYLRQAEEPTLLRGRIHSDTAEYKSNTNVTLRFIVLLSEPSGDSKKALRVKLDQSTAIKGGDRRIFLRKLIPLVSPRSKGGQQFADDLIYFDDNYGGVAFWPLPIKEVSTPVDFSQNFDTAFLTGSISDFKLALRGWVCEHRWPLRAIFELLLLIGAACAVALILNCTWRARWGRYMPLGALPPLSVGSLLFAFDPGLKPLRESPFLLWTLLVAVTIWAVLAMRRTQVEKP
ncbi:putative Ig domain-containing protein [Paucibacter sp. DJ1R-11]|uniref:putative Ig domain-containing protein n=1 Tax=Paucibacter sp. DJ1R-11 TaxID=2893556 RepID=UPI0021E459D0|nr:putative Ig domain-containing protein [Paucibacter sp. DJ1R-11]MCV2363933.1 putative Ig domain-containing protein [Paucibacter sp. DJ1R-11]